VANKKFILEVESTSSNNNQSATTKMSPTKRSNEEGWDQQDLKRIRGGGEDDLIEDEELYDEELIDMAAEEEEEIAQSYEVAVEGEEENTGSSAYDSFDDHVVAASKSKWVRPPLAADCDNKADLNVQWLDIDTVGGKPLEQNPNRSKQTVVGNTNGQEVPVIRVFGVNETGHSCTVFIHGFTPYAYFALPSPEFQPSMFEQNRGKTLKNIRKVLDDRLRMAARGTTLQQYVLGVEYTSDHKSIMGYETKHTQFIKVYLAMPTLVPTLKRVMGEGVDLGGSIVPGAPAQELSFEPFECNVPFVLRYMIDQDITGAGWLTLPSETYRFRSETNKTTHCQVSWARRYKLTPVFV